VAEYLRMHIIDEGVSIHGICFDRWRIEHLQASAKRMGLTAWKWLPVGQGFRDMSVRVEEFETALLQKRVLHGGAPTLNWGAASAIAEMDAAANRKLAKGKSPGKIDVLVASLMAAYPYLSTNEEFDLTAFA
jgi:phage terminase large subunit-like protein